MAALSGRHGGSRHLLIRAGIGAAAVALVCGSTLLAQDVTEPSLKAAFLFNFVKFTDWSAETVAPELPLLLCVLGDESVRTELEQAVKGNKIGTHALNVIPVHIDGQLRACHLLYVTGLDRRQVQDLVGKIRDAPVFTVSDLDRFAELGGVLQLFVEGGKMRFAINPVSVLRARLRISSKVMALAKLVKDESGGR
jgi:hypothetical protein